MKYIRTKDGKIFDLEDIKKQLIIQSAYPHLKDWKLEPTNDKRGALRLSWMADFKGSKSKPEKLKTPRECAVILDCESSEYKQADAIEELCDEFIYTDDTFKNVLYKRLEPIKSLIKLRHNYQVFGAIWVVGENNEPILKSVAKMNNKGELELL